MRNGRKLYRLVFLLALIGLVVAAAATSAVADDDGAGSQDLLAYWPFDEGNGTVASDVTGNGFDGTVIRAGWTNDGVCGSALEFANPDDQSLDPDDPRAEYVTTPFRLTQVTDQTEFTLTGWFKTASQKTQVIMGYYNGTDLIITLLNEQQPNDVHFNLRDPSVQRNTIEVTTGLNLDDNRWHHIVFRRKTTSELDIYVDGSLQPKTVLFDDVLPDHGQAADWHIGAWNDVFQNAVQYGFQGKLDEIKIYGHALSDGEIAEQFDEPCELDDDLDDDGLDDDGLDDDDAPAFSQDPTDYLLFETGDIPADGVPALDGESLLDHGWEPGPSGQQPPNILASDAEYDADGPKFGALSIFSPLSGTNLRFDLGGAVSGVTFQADIYDNLDSSTYTNVRYNISGTTVTTEVNGGEIAIFTGSGGSVTYYSVWDGSWHTTAVPRSVGFHTFTIYVEGTRTEYFIDGQLAHTDTVPRGTHMTKVGMLSSAQVGGFNETQEVWFDNIFVWLGSPAERPIGDDDADDADDEAD